MTPKKPNDNEAHPASDHQDETRLVELAIRSLDRIDGRLAALEASVARIEAVARPAVATLVDTADELVARLAVRGIDFDARARSMLALVEQLSAPAVLAPLSRLIARIEQLDAVVATADKIPGLVATVVDTFDSIVTRLRESDIDVDATVRSLLRVAERLTRRETLRVVEAVLDTGVLDPAALATIRRIGQAVAKTGSVEPNRTGLFGLLRALRDPEVQRATGFLVDLARNFGSDFGPLALVHSRGEHSLAD